jgi:hypothetical protein
MPEQFDSHNTMAAFNHDSTLVIALELSGKSWQVGAVVPGWRGVRGGGWSRAIWRGC